MRNISMQVRKYNSCSLAPLSRDTLSGTCKGFIGVWRVCGVRLGELQINMCSYTKVPSVNSLSNRQMIVLQTATWKFLPNTRIFVSPFMWPFGNILNTIGVKFWNVCMQALDFVSIIKISHAIFHFAISLFLGCR